MPGLSLERLGLARLARATQTSFNWMNLAPGAKQREADEKRREAEKAALSNEILDKLIEAEIIPRLMLTSREEARTSPVASDSSAPLRFDAGEIDGFARKAVIADPEDLIAEVETWMSRGVTHDDLLLKFLAPVARRLGAMWEDDICDFTEVTIGLMKLHRVLEHVNADTPCGAGASASSPRILLAPAPGEQHVFGVVMVGEFFVRSGWRVRCELSTKSEQLVATVSEEHFDTVGLSASSDTSMEKLRSVIQLVRTASLNPSVVIMAGGQMFNEDADLARRVGADATAADAVRAVVTAERFVHTRARAARPISQ